MKNTILKSILSLFVLTAMISCTSESTTYNDTADTAEFAQRSKLWEGVIGVDRGEGVFEITADKDAIITDLEDVLRRQGKAASLKVVEILGKTAVNDPTHRGFMLVGSNRDGISIGVWLKLDGGNFSFDPEIQIATSCTGCATGCNLQYLTIDGKKVAYCNENGCVYDCTKSETSFAQHDDE